jgi:hypothetical protein
MGFLRALLVPFTTAYHIAGALWNRSCDWGWHISIRIAAALLVFGGVLFFFLWAFAGFQWPLFGT